MGKKNLGPKEVVALVKKYGSRVTFQVLNDSGNLFRLRKCTKKGQWRFSSSDTNYAQGFQRSCFMNTAKPGLASTTEAMFYYNHGSAYLRNWTIGGYTLDKAPKARKKSPARKRNKKA